MRPDLVAAALRALADAIEAPANDAVSTEPYDRDHLPPGVKTWRPVLDARRRGELTLTKIGRRCVLARDEWSRYLAARTTRRGPVVVQDADREALARMGVQLRAVAGGRR